MVAPPISMARAPCCWVQYWLSWAVAQGSHSTRPGRKRKNRAVGQPDIRAKVDGVPIRCTGGPEHLASARGSAAFRLLLALMRIALRPLYVPGFMLLLGCGSSTSIVQS